MSSRVIEITINLETPKDDGEAQVTETIVTLNWDHVTMVAPRLRGGTVIQLANGKSLVAKETRAEINQALIESKFSPKSKIKESKVIDIIKDAKKRKRKAKD